MKDLPPAKGKESSQNPGEIVSRGRSILGSTERLVFATLCDYANGNPGMWPDWISESTGNAADPTTGYAAWPSVLTIAERTALGNRSIQKALRNLERSGAIQCLYRSRGGAPRRYAKSGRTTCYLITPHSVQGFGATQTDVANTATPHLVPNNPAASAPNNPARGAPEEFNHHHQREESNKNKQRSRNSKRFHTITKKTSDPASRFDDDENKRAPFEDPGRELIARMTERHPLDDPEKLTEMIWSELDYNPTELTEFLKFDWAYTGAPNKIRNAGGHYRALIQKFKRSKNARIVSALKDQQRRIAATAEKSRQHLKPVCALGKCCGDGIISAGEMPLAICECEIGQNFPPGKAQALRDLIAKMGGMQ